MDGLHNVCPIQLEADGLKKTPRVLEIGFGFKPDIISVFLGVGANVNGQRDTD